MVIFSRDLYRKIYYLLFVKQCKTPVSEKKQKIEYFFTWPGFHFLILNMSSKKKLRDNSTTVQKKRIIFVQSFYVAQLRTFIVGCIERTLMSEPLQKRSHKLKRQKLPGQSRRIPFELPCCQSPVHLQIQKAISLGEKLNFI